MSFRLKLISKGYIQVKKVWSSYSPDNGSKYVFYDLYIAR